MQRRYRGCKWDFRSGEARPLEYGGFNTHLNRTFFRWHMAGHPDRELADHIEHGFRLADLDHKFVLMPHLMGLGDGFASAQKEVRRLVQIDLQKCF